MTIITSTLSFNGYPFEAIKPSFYEPMIGLIKENKRWKGLNSTLIRLECYLQITNQSLDLNDLATASGSEKIYEFCGALFSTKFTNPKNNPWVEAHDLKRAIFILFPDFKLNFTIPSTLNINSWPPGFIEKIHTFEAMSFNDDRLSFWRGWAVQNIKGKKQNLRFWAMYQRFGAEVTNQLHLACKKYLLSSTEDAIPVVQEFSEFISQYEHPIVFTNSSSIEKVLRDFFQHYFTSRHSKGLLFDGNKVSWKRFVNLLNNHLLGQCWAKPSKLPNPNISTVDASKRNVSKSNDGEWIKGSLITPIPLQFTDTQAKELLFRQIKFDFDILLRWARTEVAESRYRVTRRKLLAKQGIASSTSKSILIPGLIYRKSRECPDHIAHAAATFETNGLNIGRNPKEIYPSPLEQTAFELGLPQPHLLLAHATVLIANHPVITPSFLENLELYNKDGIQTGLIRTDAGWYLCSTKMRKGAVLAQQNVLLNAESLQVVEDIIEMTQHLRNWLRLNGQDKWRLLFLSISSMGSTSMKWNPNLVAGRQTDWLTSKLQSFDEIDSNYANYLTKRFSLKRVRSTAALLIYLETGSVEQMSKALGHTKYDAKLLDHYLPRPIQAFFNERWVRLFQTGIICEALKDSPFLLEASNFNTMMELDEFLENHALKHVPVHLKSPDNIGGVTQELPKSTVVFGVETGVLTILISIQSAVRLSIKDPCGRAIRWARIADVLIPHLESQSEQPEFRDMLHEAQKHANPRLVEKFIYG